MRGMTWPACIYCCVLPIAMQSIMSRKESDNKQSDKAEWYVHRRINNAVVA